jgi:hypothetical protein
VKNEFGSVDKTTGITNIEALSTANFQNLERREVVCNIRQEVRVDECKGGERQRRQGSERNELAWLENEL